MLLRGVIVEGGVLLSLLTTNVCSAAVTRFSPLLRSLLLAALAAGDARMYNIEHMFRQHCCIRRSRQR